MDRKEFMGSIRNESREVFESLEFDQETWCYACGKVFSGLMDYADTVLQHSGTHMFTNLRTMTALEKNLLQTFSKVSVPHDSESELYRLLTYIMGNVKQIPENDILTDDDQIAVMLGITDSI